LALANKEAALQKAAFLLSKNTPFSPIFKKSYVLKYLGKVLAIFAFLKPT
jgi:hypothetical protein